MKEHKLPELVAFFRAEGVALIWVAAFATLLALTGVAYVVLKVDPSGPEAFQYFALLGKFIWTNTFVYLLPFASTVGVATFLMLRKVRHRLLQGAASAVTTAFCAWFAYPAVEQCYTSMTTRQLVLHKLTPEEAATFRSLATLSDTNDYCPTFFTYRTSAGWIEVSGVFDLVSGVQIFKRP